MCVRHLARSLLATSLLACSSVMTPTNDAAVDSRSRDALAADQPTADAIVVGLPDSTILDTRSTDGPSAVDAEVSDGLTIRDADHERGDDAPPTLVETCESLAQRLEERCESDPQTACTWRAYRGLCRAGHTPLLIASMRCFDASSECSTFAYPNDASACLELVHLEYASEASRAAIRSLCRACKPAGSIPCPVVNPSMEVLPYLLEGDLVQINDCRGDYCEATGIVVQCAAIRSLTEFAYCVR